MNGEGWALAFAGSRVLLLGNGLSARIPTDRELAALIGDLDQLETPVALPRAAGRRTRAFDLPANPVLPGELRAVGLREAYYVLPADLFRVLGTARQKVEWYRTHGFCSRCGAPTSRHETHEAMACHACGQLQFARLAPAVIVLVERGREMLLGRSPHFPPGVYSTIAGFVEPGESLEECVHREIEEEVGVRVDNLRYFGSQPHPFPHSLMLGFVADWAGGEVRIDRDELEDAGWFAPGGLPELPHPMSIARALIEDFLARSSGG